jgi:hypothetical protein
MQKVYALLASLLIVGGTLLGCASDKSQNSSTGAPGRSREAADKVFFYKQQAAELRGMADRLEYEAQWYANQAGAENEEAKRHRAMAKELRSGADEADQSAGDYRRQVPHNQVN